MTVTESSFIKESQDRYLTYALSVVSGRALPDIRDGLKPVQRRILYAMLKNLNLKHSGNHKKSAAVVGEVLAKFHPHGDVSCYEAMVRMAQSFSYRYPLVDGQGNFGSLDGDSAAAYRYTEVRLQEIALEILGEIDEETVGFRDNFDSTTIEPAVLPSRIPNLLVNGVTGIAVGMATNIPPHNLKEVNNALIALIKDPKLTISNILNHIKGPDFPVGCSILNSKSELKEIYQSGRGPIKMRGNWKLEPLERGKKGIVVNSIPYTVNKATLVEKIASLIIDKKLPLLIDVRDESTEEIRIVLELANDADPELVLAYLYKNTNLELNFNVNLTCLIPDGQALIPRQTNLKEILQVFIDFRIEVVKSRLLFEKKNLEERLHILEGFKKIFDKLDEAIKIVRKSDGRSDAAEKLRKKFKLTEIQSFAVVDMRIYQLSRTNIDEILAELKEKKKRVAEIEKILKSIKKIKDLVIKDLEKISEKFGDKRLSKIIKNHQEEEFNESDYIVQEDVFAIITRDGWIKRIRQSNDYESTRIREGDSILTAHAASTVDTAVIFSNLGYLYSINVTDFPSSSGYGDPIQKILKFRDGEKVVKSFLYRSENSEFNEKTKILLVSAKGMGFTMLVGDFLGLKRSGRRVMKPKKDDALVSVIIPSKKQAFFTKKASGLVLPAKEIPDRNPGAVGVILMSIRKDDELVGAFSFKSACKIPIRDAKGKIKDIDSSKITSGRRALKGTKVMSTGKISGVLDD